MIPVTHTHTHLQMGSFTLSHTLPFRTSPVSFLCPELYVFSSPVRGANRGSTSLILEDLTQVDTGLQGSQDISRSGPDQREGIGSLESSIPSWVRLFVWVFMARVSVPP